MCWDERSKSDKESPLSLIPSEIVSLSSCFHWRARRGLNSQPSVSKTWRVLADFLIYFSCLRRFGFRRVGLFVGLLPRERQVLQSVGNLGVHNVGIARRRLHVSMIEGARDELKV